MAATASDRWIPNPGPQTDAYFCEADELFYGGAAGGGKTDLICGLALNEHTRALVMRREGTDLRGIEQRMTEIMGGQEGYNQQRREWKLGVSGHVMELGSCPHEKDKFGFQGRPHDLKAYDEVTQFTRSQVQYINGWNRTTKEGQRCRIVYTGNPPSTPEGAWIKVDFAPWLDPHFPNPARPGELRWFTTIKGETVWVDGPEPIEIDGEMISPRSRTFIPAYLDDNPFLGEEYEAVIAAMPEPLRTQLRKGDFNVAESDQANQVIPTAWVRLAQQRWREDGELAPMVSMGVDVAQGGDDRFVLAPRHLGDHVAELKIKPGKEVRDGPDGAAFFITHQRHGAQANVDMGGGYGGDVRTQLRTAGVQVFEFNPAGAATREAINGLKFVNMRAQAYWTLREILDPASDRRVSLPLDEELVAELCAPTWKPTPRGIQIEPKEKIIERLGRSPDKADAVVCAFIDPKDDVAYQVMRERRAPPTAQGFDPLWD